MKKHNENCLAGLRCPQCRSLGPFLIMGTSTFLVYDDGTEEHDGVEWEGGNPCTCRACGRSETVSAFEERNQPLTPEDDDEDRVSLPLLRQ